MPNSKPIKIGKVQSPNLSCKPICNVFFLFIFFLSKIAFSLQIIHPNRFKMHLEPKHCYFDVCINQQIFAIALEFTYAPIYIWPMKGWKIVLISYVWHNNQCERWTRKNIRNNLSTYNLRTCDIGKQHGCLHLVKVQSETQPWSTDRGLPLLHTYSQGVFEW